MLLSPRFLPSTGSGAYPPLLPQSSIWRILTPIPSRSVQCQNDCDCGVNQRCGIPAKKEDQVPAPPSLP